MSEKPLIGVPAMSSAQVKGLRKSGSTVSDTVVKAITAAGGIPVLISPFAPDEIWDSVAGIVLPGGNDVTPSRYGQDPHPTYGPTDFEGQDEADLRAISVAEERRIPALLICRGMQLWNVHRGGDMIQDIENSKDHVGTEHDVAIASDSLLHSLFDGADTVNVSSYHHQALGRIGDGLRVVAHGSDGTVEAIEDPEFEIVAVQWHPEDRFERIASDARLFEWVVAAAKSHRTTA
ncbi:gamma-glutamyl-gamma-aminobutyrate hydrolase family protein [Canibacter zhoujuaniae]|uniref:gamma-glutamyl-gamma-aminobutyrate hydrolase family protein n=1 Tax=Canibacter zhoujuaniae TaxID=2708343 RepID=UPI0014234200|nr:gamma-glutamyl-gamma-aminobutyrate hydrolase family protein [Canibacter zhoujuaniae]